MTVNDRKRNNENNNSCK